MNHDENLKKIQSTEMYKLSPKKISKKIYFSKRKLKSDAT